MVRVRVNSPHCSGSLVPCIVKVLPVPVWPYAKMHTWLGLGVGLGLGLELAHLLYELLHALVVLRGQFGLRG